MERLYAETNFSARLRADPIRFPRRYTDPEDVALAALLSASFAYGRVDLFPPVLERLFAVLDEAGGPIQFVREFEADRDGPRLDWLVYRWSRGIDLTLLFLGLRRLFEQGLTLRQLFTRGFRPEHKSAREALDGAVESLRDAVLAEAWRAKVDAPSFDDLPRGLRFILVRPADGSANKRWNMFLRWMVRSGREGVDLGLWTELPPSALLMPLDTHVLRISKFLGLIPREQGTWRVAEALTTRLRRLDPDDPTRYDFALAHLGISGLCPGHRDAEACPRCPLLPVCAAPSP